MKLFLSFCILLVSGQLIAKPSMEMEPSYVSLASEWGLAYDDALNNEKSLINTSWRYNYSGDLIEINSTLKEWNSNGRLTFLKHSSISPEGKVRHEVWERLHYDDNGRLILLEKSADYETIPSEVAFFYENKKLFRIEWESDGVNLTSYSFTYDNKGRILSEIAEDSSGYKTKLVFQYQDEKVVFRQRTRYRADGVITSDNTETLVYEDNRLASIHYYFSAGNSGNLPGHDVEFIDWIRTFTYDANGNLIRDEVVEGPEVLDVKVFVYDEQNRLLEDGYVFGQQWGSQWFGFEGSEYDDQGRVIIEYEKDIYFENKKIRCSYEYQPNLEIKTNYDIHDGKKLSSIWYSYLNSAGDVEKKLEYDPDMNLQTSTFYTYDQAGNLIETVEEQDGRRFTMQKAVYEYY